jgi:hypothetical protein
MDFVLNAGNLLFFHGCGGGFSGEEAGANVSAADYTHSSVVDEGAAGKNKGMYTFFRGGCFFGTARYAPGLQYPLTEQTQR